MSSQFAPLASQRWKRKEKLIGWSPVHVPGLAVRVLPACAVPEIDGATVFVGASCAVAVPYAKAASVTAVHNVFMALRFVLSDVPGATPKKPASGLMA